MPDFTAQMPINVQSSHIWINLGTTYLNFSIPNTDTNTLVLPITNTSVLNQILICQGLINELYTPHCESVIILLCSIKQSLNN